MYTYYLGRLLVAKQEENRRYSNEIERFYQETKHKTLEDIHPVVNFYENLSMLERFCLKIGLSRESPQAIGYKIRLREFLKESTNTS